MYLKTIKVSGFKSFADLQVVHFKDPFTCIVGPNGCGKSNIIDAVKWVIGESSAKNLRGTALTDVIFNGSTSRKPQGMAKVELIFDNSQGRLGGKWSAFKEISLSRTLYRDGQSNYFLNQTRCRRKDIIELFLGTGLGPRSYAIIEQGMVNKFIDAKPQDMRLQIEEASGVSKYKEKRKETYSKLQEAEENLEKLQLSCHEIEKRVNALKKQAAQATKYQELKEKWAGVRTDMYSVMWRQCSDSFDSSNHDLKTFKFELSETQNVYQNFQVKNANCFKNLEIQEQNCLSLDQSHQNLILELKDLQLHWQKQQDKIAYQSKEIKEHEDSCDEINKAINLVLQKEEAFFNLDDSSEQIKELEMSYQSFKSQVSDCKLAYEKSHQEYQNLLKLKQAPQSEAEVIKSQIGSLEHSILVRQQQVESFAQEEETLIARKASYEDQLKTFDNEFLAKQCRDDKEELERVEYKIDSLRGKKLDFQRQKIELDTEKKMLSKHLDKLQKLLDKYDNKPLSELEKSIGSYKKLFSDLHPKAEFTKQVAHLVGQTEVISISQAPAIDKLQWSSSRKLQLFWGEECYSDVFESPDPSNALFKNYRFLNSWDQLEDSYRNLSTEQVLVMPNGALLGKNFLIPAFEEEVKSRAQCVVDQKEYQEKIALMNNNIEVISKQIHDNDQLIQELVGRKDTVKSNLSEGEKKLNKMKIDTEKLYIQIQHITQTMNEKRLQNDKSLKEIKESQESVVLKREKLGELVLLIENQESSLEQSEMQVKQVADQLKILEGELDVAHKAFIDEQSQYEQLQRDKESLAQEKERYYEQQSRLKEKVFALKASIEQGTPELTSLDKEIISINQKIESIQAQKSEGQKKLDELKKMNQDLTQERKAFERKIQSLKDNIHKSEIKWEKALVSQNHVKEQIFDLGLDFETLKKLQPTKTKEILKKELGELEKEIDALGAINLNACAEFDQESLRFTEMTSQCEDIEQSCSILKDAVDSLDKEIIQTYQSTLNSLQTSFAELFPKLFGGGQASLREVEIEGQSEKGIIVFAQPPGKKNASLSALSGGEKALTAAALVFSFFNLNPAPFCLMDEIDAPLDDSNTARLANMLNYLSEKVQCLCVTHSKITMEKSHALYGVTMREPGVSRLVSVDLRKAENMIS